MSDDRPLDRLARAAGILPGYRDALGNDHVVSSETKLALLRAMNIAADSADAIEASLQHLDAAPWRRMADPVMVMLARRGARCEIPITLSADRVASIVAWRFEAEDGTLRKGQARYGDLPLVGGRRIDGKAMERRVLTLPFPTAIGRHRVSLRVEGGPAGDREQEGETALPLIVAPARCYLPPRVPGRNPRLWGLALQLYGLRSRHNWGIGDFADLSYVTDMVAPLGAAAIGVNPLHALFPQWPSHRSPYSPSHRQFLAIHYIAIDLIGDFAECEEARRMVATDDFQHRIEAARQRPLVDYDAVSSLKRPVFEQLYRWFRDHHLAGPGESKRARSFRDFQAAKGETLRHFAIFQALSEHFPYESWRRWPEPFRDPRSSEVSAFAARNHERVEFYEYLQWQANGQAKAAQAQARKGGMAVGLYHDLALAPDGSGAEAWAHQDLFARGATLGAPPDLWNQLGQNWGLPPYVPLALRADGYRQLSGVIRAIMEPGGALRVDHAIGLERMFWIPEGGGPADGGYVRYPVDDLFAVLALESVREKSLIIGEDLGTLPEGFHKRMQSAGMLSYRLLYFEQDKRGEFIKPSRYPALAAAAVTTHDLATFKGYWQARDLQIRDQLEQFPSDEVKAESFARRAIDRRALIRALKRERLLPEETADDAALTPDLIEAVYRYIARSPSLLMLLGIEDVAGEYDQANLPGTIDQHPNWQRKLSRDLEDLMHDDVLRRLARAIGEERGQGQGQGQGQSQKASEGEGAPVSRKERRS